MCLFCVLTYFGGLCPFIFQVPTKMATSRLGQVRSSSTCPRRDVAPILPCKKFLCLAFEAGIKCRTCAASRAFLAKLSVLLFSSGLSCRTFWCEKLFSDSKRCLKSSWEERTLRFCSETLLQRRRSPFMA